MGKPMDLTVTRKTDEELRGEGWIVSGKFIQGDTVREREVRSRIEEQQKNGWTHIVRVMGKECQVYRNRKGGR